MKSKAFWYALMSGAIAGWIFVFAGVLAALAGSPYWTVPALGIPWIAFCVIWASHLFEIPVASWRAGKERGLKPARTVLMTLVFGFTWWLPLKKGILDARGQGPSHRG
jgi:hypothetical protein